VHKAIKLCEEALIATDPTITSLGPNIEVINGSFKFRPEFLDYFRGLNVSIFYQFFKFLSQEILSKVWRT